MVGSVSTSLEKYMDLLAARQKLVTSNIANIDTPGYKTKDIDFQSEFQSLLNGSSSTPAPQNVSGLKVKNDGNNVNIDREARLLSENAMKFTLASQLIRGQIKSIRSAIEEGRSS